MHRCLPALGLLALVGGCNPPNVTPARAVVELYMHPNGLSNCVDENDGRWKNDPSCCPEGFEFVGFSVPSAVEYPKDDKTTRRLYRHVVCLELPPTPPGPQ
jgi:hypothetical protein